MFRPEMLEPMGLPKNVRVLGWGMSLERRCPCTLRACVMLADQYCFSGPTMIKYGINDIRTLVGHKTDIAQVKAAAAVRLDKGL